MSQSLVDLVAPHNEHESGKVYGVAVGIVTNNKDDNGMGRIRVKLPWLSDDQESWWARVGTPMAGGGRGAYFLPEVGDEVLIAFEHGDMRFPYVLGSLWNGQDKPPTTNDDGKNNIRVIKSRSGHIVRLDDTDGDEKIEVIDKTQSNSITLKSSDNSITITCNGRMKLQGVGIEIASQDDVKITANSTMDVSAQATLNINGAIVNINS
ncbi:MAG: hypothetical protein JOY62_01155 [Acidobacteriaceae bacterium]|nr:hypothetical protein [Acidobacteriaceae bacterium]MBV9778553.1 hypothetical protein [Acidobacteriaceae bacterium]